MDDPAAHGSSRSETDVVHEKVRRRMEEDWAAAKASFCEAITQRPGEFQKSTFQYKKRGAFAGTIAFPNTFRRSVRQATVLSPTRLPTANVGAISERRFCVRQVEEQSS